VPANQICNKAIMTYFFQLECSLSVERIVYFLKKEKRFFVALFSEKLPVGGVVHLASCLAPQQKCAARRH
jgi:hypothetical protein